MKFPSRKFLAGLDNNELAAYLPPLTDEPFSPAQIDRAMDRLNDLACRPLPEDQMLSALLMAVEDPGLGSLGRRAGRAMLRLLAQGELRTFGRLARIPGFGRRTLAVLARTLSRANVDELLAAAKPAPAKAPLLARIEAAAGEEAGVLLETKGIELDPAAGAPGDDPFLRELFAGDGAVLEKVPADFERNVLRALAEPSSAAGIVLDARFMHPESGAFSETDGERIIAARETAGGFTKLSELGEALGASKTILLLQSYIAEGLLAPSEEEPVAREIEFAFEAGLAPGEGEAILSFLNNDASGEAVAELIGPERGELFPKTRPFKGFAEVQTKLGLDGAGLSRIAGFGLAAVAPAEREQDAPSRLLRAGGFAGLAELLEKTGLGGTGFAKIARAFNERLQLRGGEIEGKKDFAKVPELADAIERLCRYLEEPDDGCRIRIDGKPQAELYRAEDYFGVVEVGPTDGQWSWEIIPSGRANFLGISRAVAGGPHVRYEPIALPGGFLVATYTAPDGEVCRAGREITHTAECVVHFKPGPSILRENETGIQRRIVRLPEGRVDFSILPGSTSAGAGVRKISDLAVEINAGDTGTFSVLAAHEKGCTDIAHFAVREPTEVRRPAGENGGNCEVEFVESHDEMKVGETKTFRAQGTPPGGTYEWESLPAAGARIVPNTGDTVRVTRLRSDGIGIRVTYRTPDCSISQTTAINELPGVTLPPEDRPPDLPPDWPPEWPPEELKSGVNLVRKVKDDEPIPAVPIVQHVPNAEPEAPRTDGKPLQPRGDFIIREVRVLDKWEKPGFDPVPQEEISLADLQPSVRVDIRFAGRIWDALGRILGFAVEIEGGKKYNFDPAKFEYTDTTFKKWYPDPVDGENVQVEGLGVRHFRLRPQNSLSRLGIYHGDIGIELSEEGSKAVSDAHAQLEELLATPQPEDEQGQKDRNKRVQARIRAVVSAWRKALASVEVRCRANEHIFHPINIGKHCYFKVRANAEEGGGEAAGLLTADASGTVQALPSPEEPIGFGPGGVGVISDEPNDGEYFVTLENYNGSFGFKDKGLLRGRRNELTRAVFATAAGGEAPAGFETKDEEITFGIEVTGPSCVEIERGDPIRLVADGIPRSWKELRGLYDWVMVSHPAHAEWDFEPVGPTFLNETDVKIYQPGHYVIRVNYRIDDPRYTCNQTYAIFDLQVVMKGEDALFIRRLGDYPAEFEEHIGRPHYRRRIYDPEATAETSEGADLLFLPFDQGSFGNRKSLTLACPDELRMDRALTVRVYSTPDFKEYREWTGRPVVTMGLGTGNAAAIDVESIDPIFGIHITRLRYHDLPALRGQVVEMRVSPGPGMRCPDDSTGGVVNPLDIDETNNTHRPPEEKILRKINLILYENDPGAATPSKGTPPPLPGAEDFQINLTNGVLHFQQPLFQWEGRGVSLGCSLAYNSFRANQLKSLEKLIDINGVSPLDLEREYGRIGPGYGWNFTYGVHVIDYVRSEAGERIRARLELVDEDSNQIQFEIGEDGVYRPADVGTLFRDDPEAGAGLEIAVTKNDEDELTGYELSDHIGNVWRFDDEGRLREISPLYVEKSGGAMQALLVEPTESQIVVTDGVNRVMICPLAAWNKRVLAFQNPEVTYELETGDEAYELGGIVFPKDDLRLEFRYDPQIAQMVALRNRAGRVTDLKPLLEGLNWGRTEELKSGDLKFEIKYDDPEAGPARETLVRDARKTEWRFTYDRFALAVRRTEVFRTVYANDLGATDAGWELLAEYDYFEEPGRGKGKFLHLKIDRHATREELNYKPSPSGRTFVVENRKHNGDLLHTYEYHPETDQLLSETDFENNVQEYDYDDFGNVKLILMPELRPGGRYKREFFYDADGRLVWQTDELGRRTTFGYGEEGRDPHRTGMPTSATFAGRTTKMAYWPGGLLRYKIDPVYGGRTDYTYDELDRHETTVLPEIPVFEADAITRDRRETIRMIYHDNGMLEKEQVALGGSTTYRYDEHDRLEGFSDPEGGWEYAETDAYGAPLQESDRGGRAITTRRDHLARPLEIRSPAAAEGLESLELFFYESDAKRTVKYVRGPAGSSGNRMGYPRRHTETEYDVYGNVLETRRWTEPRRRRKSKVARTVLRRDRYGTLEGMEYHYGGAKRYEETYILDQWRRRIGVNVAGAVTRYELWPNDKVSAIITPDHGGGTIARWSFRYDELWRLHQVLDPNGVVVREERHSDATDRTPARKTVLGIPRDAAHGTTGLRILSVTQYNARGNPTRRELPGLPALRIRNDLRGRQIGEDQGDRKMRLTLDGAGRTIGSREEAAGDVTVGVQRFHPAGNLEYASQGGRSVRYRYTATDQLLTEHVTEAGFERLLQSMSYDVFGRPVRKETDEQGTRVISIVYDDLKDAAKYTARDTLGFRQELELEYHWNGHYKSFTRKSEGREVLKLTASEPDALGRVATIDVECLGIKGGLTRAYHPAGTRASLNVRVGGRTFTQDDYRYTMDWRLFSLTSASGGRYVFNQEPSGVMSGWQTPGGIQYGLEFDSYGSPRSLTTKRPGPAGTAPYLESSREERSDGAFRGRPERILRLFRHQAGEVPDTGETQYSTRFEWKDDPTQPEFSTRFRRGFGEEMRRIDDSEPGKDNSRERWEFLDDPDKNFFTNVRTRREFFRGGSMDIISSTLNTSERELKTRFEWDLRVKRDRAGRVLSKSFRNLISPEDGSLISAHPFWMLNNSFFDRDELGRVYNYLMVLEKASDLSGKTETAQYSEQVESFYGPDGRVWGREVVVNTVNDLDEPVRIAEGRLYLHDEYNLVAEVGPGDRLIRYYEYGPGKGFRLSVLHERDGAERHDEYAYDVELKAVALTERGGKVVRRFAAGGMPLPGDDRSFRDDPDGPLSTLSDEEREARLRHEAVDDLTLSTGSELYVAGFALPLGGLPPEVDPSIVRPIGTGLAGLGADDDALGMVRVHPELLASRFEPIGRAPDSSEFPLPASSIPVVREFLDYLKERVESINPDGLAGSMLRDSLSYKLTELDTLVSSIALSLQTVEGAALLAAEYLTSVLLQRLGIPIDVSLANPILMALSNEDYVWSEYILGFFDLRDPLIMMNGYDPATGASYNWDQRVMGAHMLAMQMTDIGVGLRAPRIQNSDGCFPAGTTVWTASGPRAIEQILPGELVYTGFAEEPAPVVDLHLTRADTYRLFFEGGEQELSGSQPVALATGTFARVDHLQPGDRIVDAMSETRELLRIEQGRRSVPVFNLSVARDATYLVGHERILVHNKPTRRKTEVRPNLSRLAEFFRLIGANRIVSEAEIKLLQEEGHILSIKANPGRSRGQVVEGHHILTIYNGNITQVIDLGILEMLRADIETVLGIDLHDSKLNLIDLTGHHQYRAFGHSGFYHAWVLESLLKNRPDPNNWTMSGVKARQKHYRKKFKALARELHKDPSLLKADNFIDPV